MMLCWWNCSVEDVFDDYDRLNIDDHDDDAKSTNRIIQHC